MGPVQLQGLFDLWEKGSRGGIVDDTLLWTEHMSGWMKVKDFSELHELLQTELRSRRTVDPGRTAPCASGSEASTATAGRPAGTHQDIVEPSAPAANGSGISGVIAFLKGWLPKRADAADLVMRGILREAPTRAFGGGGAKGSRRASVPAPKAASSDALYGGSLHTILRRPDTKDGIPALVRILMGKLLMDGAEGLKHEGIFRVPGDAYEMRELRRQINEGSDAATLVQACDNMHSVAGMLKMFFRELAEPVLTFALYDECIRCSSAMGGPSESTDTAELTALLARLPPEYFDVLRCLMLFLGQVVRYTPVSKMTVGNTAAVFAPNLLRSESESIDQLADTVHVVNIVAVMIQLADRVFDVPGPSGDAQPPAAAVAPSADSAPPVASSPAGGACSAAGPALSAGASRSLAVGEPEPATNEAGADTPGEPEKWYYVNSEHQQEGPVRTHPLSLQRAEACTSHQPSLRVGRWIWPRYRECCATCDSRRAPSCSQRACRVGRRPRM